MKIMESLEGIEIGDDDIENEDDELFESSDKDDDNVIRLMIQIKKLMVVVKSLL
jgi:hypothetical protein